MMATQNWDWIFQTLGWILAGIGLPLALWALFYDRSRGRKRCPKCWYSMDGAVQGEDGSLTCPECGRSPRSTRALLRTRRRKKWACAALAMLVAAWPLGSYPKASRTGWVSILPAKVVIELIPIGGADGPFGRDVRMRLGLDPDKSGTTNVTISPDEEVYLMRRIARGNIFARPISTRWRASFGELRRGGRGIVFRFGSERSPMMYRDGTPEDESRRDALLEMVSIPTLTKPRTRDQWPRGIPVRIETKPDQWWPSGVDEDSVMKWQTRDGKQVGVAEYKWHCTLDPFDQDEVQLELEVTHAVRFWYAAPDDIIARETTHHTLAWETVDSIDDTMEPIRSSELDAHLETILLTPSATALPVSAVLDIRLNTRALDPDIASDISFGVRVEILLEGEVKGWFNAYWVGAAIGPGRSGMRWEIEGGWRNADAYLSKHRDGQWSLRIKTDPAWSLYNLEADKYWDGEISIPLTIK